MLSMTEERLRPVTVLGLVDGTRECPVTQVFARGNIHLGKSRARSVPRVFIDSARLLGQDVPDKLIVTAAEIFYQEGRLEEARVGGYFIVEEPDPTGGLHLRKWPTSALLELPDDPGAWLRVEPESEGRGYMAMILAEDGRTFLKWRLEDNAAALSDPTVEGIALLIPPNGGDDKEFAPLQFISNPRTAVLAGIAGGNNIPLFPGLPVETVKERIIRSLMAEPGERHEIDFSGPFGDHRHGFTFGRVFNTMCVQLVNQLDCSVAEIGGLAEREKIDYEEAKELFCQISRVAVTDYARRAAPFFIEHAPDAVSWGLAELAHDALWKVEKELNGGLLKSDDDLRKALTSSTNLGAARRKWRVGEPYKEGRPKGSYKPPEEKARGRLEFEDSVEEAMLKLAAKQQRVTKTAVAQAVGCGGVSPKTGNDTSLQTFNQKAKRLGVDYDRILKMVERKVGRKLR